LELQSEWDIPGLVLAPRADCCSLEGTLAGNVIIGEGKKVQTKPSMVVSNGFQTRFVLYIQYVSI